jgi:hypothetical protein
MRPASLSLAILWLAFLSLVGVDRPVWADSSRGEASGYAKAVRRFLLEEPILQDPIAVLKRLKGVPSELMTIIPGDYDDASGVIQHLGKNFLEPMRLLEAHAGSTLSPKQKEQVHVWGWNARELLCKIVCARRGMNGLQGADRQKAMDVVKSLIESYNSAIEAMIAAFNGEATPGSGLLQGTR